MATKKKTVRDPSLADDYYKDMTARKVAGGLALADAIEVTSRQREEDEANPEFSLPETDPENLPE